MIVVVVVVVVVAAVARGRVDIGDPKPDHFVTSYFFAVAFCNLVN